VAYEFGRLGGIIDVTLGEPERAANTRHDRLVVGFRTSLRGSLSVHSLLVTVVSATTSDFLQISLVGCMFASFRGLR